MPLKVLLAGPVEPVVLLAFLVRLEHVRAHARRGGQRNHHGNDDGGRKRDREFAEQAPDDAAHHQDGNEDGDQRHADGEDGEADLLRALQRGGKGLHAGFEVARDVLHHHDGVVHHKSGGDGQRHQRQIVERVAEQVHHGEGADQRNRDGDAGNERGARAAQEEEDHQDDQANGTDQRLLDGVDRGANGRGAVEHDGGLDALREARPRETAVAP